MVAGTASMIENDEELNIPDVPLAQIEDEDVDETNFSAIKNLLTDFKSKPIVVKNNADDCAVQLNRTTKNDDDVNLSVSLENLVGTFDQKITTVLKNLDEKTNQMAPVQVCLQDKVMSESQVWWTLTGNYGNILPLDFSKSITRKNQLAALNLHSPKLGEKTSRSFDAGYVCGMEEDEDEEEMRHALDFHQIINEHVHTCGDSPPISAEQVIEEIDEMMQTCDIMRSMTATTDHSTVDICSVDSMYSSMKSPFNTTMSSQTTDLDFKIKHNVALSFTGKELNAFPQSKLIAISSEMEQLIQAYNMDLVNELAYRDELEYEKEVKNMFITLLVNIQEQRRKLISDAKRKSSSGKTATTSVSQLTTASIPFDETQSTIHISTLESLIKILQAINDNNPNLPKFLTDCLPFYNNVNDHVIIYSQLTLKNI